MQNGDEASPSISPAGRGQLVKILIWYILKKRFNIFHGSVRNTVG